MHQNVAAIRVRSFVDFVARRATARFVFVETAANSAVIAIKYFVKEATNTNVAIAMSNYVSTKLRGSAVSAKKTSTFVTRTGIIILLKQRASSVKKLFAVTVATTVKIVCIASATTVRRKLANGTRAKTDVLVTVSYYIM